jgi:steroid Delta-isomerase
MTQHTHDAVARICGFFQTLTPDSLSQIPAIYAEQARFKDPFNEVHGQVAITQIYQHMFVSLHEPRFVVTRRIIDGDQVFLVWEFRFRFKRFDTLTPQTVHGGSHLALDAQGRIVDHRDYWDAAEELYEKLPVVGSLMRWLKARANR